MELLSRHLSRFEADAPRNDNYARAQPLVVTNKE
jgi:hypothetical protein